MYSNPSSTASFYYLMDLHYSQTNILAPLHYFWFYYLMDLHYSQTHAVNLRKSLAFYYLMDLHYSQTDIFKSFQHCLFYYLMDLHYSQTTLFCFLTVQMFYYLMDLHYSQTRAVNLRKSLGFTTLWIYTILKHDMPVLIGTKRFTTLWIYTILKPQISCAHYTAQGKSTRSSTIVLWRNGIVKGTQIPIQHIAFGAHIYARRCLAL